MKLVISAFPASGKSTISNNAGRYGLKWCQLTLNKETGGLDINIPEGSGVPVFDSDSSLFDKAAFPQNYIAHIKSVLSQFDDVVIFVSSHEEVRKALHDEGIEFTLVYPQRELKEEYIQRYAKRGNALGFITMMQERWNDFIDSCEADATPSKIIMEEGEFLGDTVGEAIEDAEDNPQPDNAVDLIDFEARVQRLITRRGAEGDVTAAIVSVNAEAADNDVPEPTEDNAPEPTLLNEPEANAEAVSRTELLEYKFDMQNDIDTLETVVTAYRDADPDVGGMEQFEDGSELLTNAVTDIKERYGMDVEPTIAGLEGFFGALKDALGKVVDTLKGKPSKAELAKIKKYFYESRKAVDEYSSPAWLNAQKFINVGKAKLQVPAVFKEVNTAAGMSPIVEQFSKTVLKLNDEHLRNNKARLASGIKIFNALKNKPESANNAEIDKLITGAGTVKPDALDDVKLNDVKSLINVSLASGELPVLKKDDIPGVIKILQDGLGVIDKLTNVNEDYKMDLITYDDITDSDFWLDAKTPAAMKVIEAVEFDHNYHNLDMIEEGYVQQMLVIAKFIEQWVLASVK